MIEKSHKFLKTLWDTATRALLIVAYGLAAIPVLVAYCVLKILRETYRFFNPDYTTALVNGYKRPIIGLRLCTRCHVLRYTPSSRRLRHHDDVQSLEKCATGSCWLYQRVHVEWQASIGLRDGQTSSLLDWHGPRPDSNILLWFAERTETKCGFLDHLRGTSMLLP
jgi:hypothetical protein